ncbi:Hypothetical protein DHA2_154417 [Giardia duodenalis]|uniref:IFT80/172/WDR35 TPR domain-containing protein n=1 Tax=Giardia intestinalis TaxID=5741 RepID=V6T9E3_GIAIN|nr:Hypothetical protein DHA2_154417 [Giardia intestinalis]
MYGLSSFYCRDPPNLTCLTWIGIDLAVAASQTDRCLYEIIVPPSLGQVRVSRISDPIPSTIISMTALPPGNGSSASSSTSGPAVMANTASSYQITKGSGSSSTNASQATVVAGCANGTLIFIQADVLGLGCTSQRVSIRRQKSISVSSYVGGEDAIHPVTSLCMMQPRGSSLLVGLETGTVLLLTMMGGLYQFRQILKSNLNAPVHAINSIDRNRAAIAYGGSVTVINITKNNSTELSYKLQSDGDAITALASTGRVLVLGCEHRGAIVLDLLSGLEISVIPPPPYDAVVSVSSQPVASNGFIIATRRGVVIGCRENGTVRSCATLEYDSAHLPVSKIAADGAPATLLSPLADSSMTNVDENLGSSVGGIRDLAFAPYGGSFLCLCLNGLAVGYLAPQRLSSGYITIEVTGLTTVMITDARLQVSEVYTAPEPVISLFLSRFAHTLRLGATTASSVIVWTPPTMAKISSFSSEGGMPLVTKIQWITEPVRSTSYGDMIRPSTVQNQPSTQGLPNRQQQELDFDNLLEKPGDTLQQTESRPLLKSFSQKKLEHDKASNPPTKTAAYVRNPPRYIVLGDSYHLVVDISGEANIVSATTLALVTSIYISSLDSDRQIAIIDSALAYVEGGTTLRIIDPRSGNFILRGVIHHKAVLDLTIGISSQQHIRNASETSAKEGTQGNAVSDFALGSVFSNLTGHQAGKPVDATASTSSLKQTEMSSNDASSYVLALLDTSNSLYVGRLTTSPQAYAKLGNSMSTAILQQSKFLDSIPYSIQFIAQTDLLCMLISESQSLPRALSQIGETVGSDCKLRLVVDACPVRTSIITEDPVFVTPTTIDYSSVQRSNAAVSIFEEDPSRILAAYRMLSRSNIHTIHRITPMVLKNDGLMSNAITMSHAVLGLAGDSSQMVVAVPEFSVLLNYLAKSGNTQRALRLCRFLDQKPLWAQMATYCIEANNIQHLQSALSGLGMVAKASYCHSISSQNEVNAGAVKLAIGDPEGANILSSQGKIGAAILAACDLWNFSKALELCRGNKKYMPLLVYLRTKYHNNLGMSNCNNEEPWLSLSRQYGNVSEDEIHRLMKG